MTFLATSFFLGKIGQENVFCDILERKSAFLGYKNKKFKKSKNCHFFKGVSPWFWYRNGHFSNCFFFFKKGQENVFYDILERKKCLFSAIKTKRSKSGKVDIFQQGLTHGFGPKMAIFSTSFFLAIQARKMCFTIFQNEGTPFQALKTRSSKSPKNCQFSNGVNPWFWFKNSHCFNVFWRGKTGHENVFQDILARKNTFLGFKNKEIKTSKYCHFSERVNPWFWSTKGHFFNFFFQAKQARKMCFTIFQNEKTPFQAIKTRRSKSRKIVIFLKGLTHCFWTKMAFLATSFYQAKQAWKMSFTITQNQKTPFYALKKKFKKTKNCYFSKGVNPWFLSKDGHFSNFFF